MSHTRWGFIHGVEPGSFTEDHPGNRVSLGELRELARGVPSLVTYAGHEERPVRFNELE